MKVVSFNINGIRARLHQLQALIDAHQPDVIGLQEITVHDEQFPVKAVEDMGYEVFFHGQKSHYGVAFLAKKSPTAVIKGFPTDDEDAQRRMIILKTTDDAGDPVTILNGYFPHPDPPWGIWSGHRMKKNQKKQPGCNVSGPETPTGAETATVPRYAACMRSKKP